MSEVGSERVQFMVTVSFANQTVLEVGLRMEIAAIGHFCAELESR